MSDETKTEDAPISAARIAEGVVTRSKNAKTRRVEIQRLVKHPMYGKYIKKRTMCYVHDENNESELGDTVQIVECRPMSRTKRWRLTQVLKRAPSRTLSNLEGTVAGGNATTASDTNK